MPIFSRLTFATTLLLGLCCSDTFGATFQWNDSTQNWSAAAGWAGGVVPPGTNFADILSFGGDTGTVLGTAPNYTATNDIVASPFLLNAISLNATNVSALATDPALNIAGGALRFGGVNPGLVQNGAGAFTFTTPVAISNTMGFGGNGAGVVTLNRGVSGIGSIVKDGASVFRFGTTPVAPALVGPSENTWFGPLVINAGIVRFNNNADSGRTAIRGNPVAMAVGTTLICSSELRHGVLSGAGGMVESQVAGTNANTEDIVISAFGSGVFSGTVRLGIPTGTGNDVGTLVVRGPGEQTFAGTVNITKDLAVGGNLVLSGTVSLSAQSTGAVVMSGGTLRLENSVVDHANRLRDGDAASTGLDTIGGGLFQLSGNGAGSAETIGRLQLSSLTVSGANKGRSGQLSLQIIHRSATAPTVLTIASYNRDVTVTRALNTVEFSALNASSAPLALGITGANPRIIFATAPSLGGSLLASTAGTVSVGWATVKTPAGIAFATHGVNGIAPVATTALVPGTSSATANSELTGSANITLASYAQNSIRLAPTAAGTSLALSAGTTLNTTAIALAGENNFSITGGTLGGGGPRFITVEKSTLTLASGLGAAQALVKSGSGALSLTNVANTSATQPLAINGGTVLATPGTTLPAGELRFRGGTLGIVGGGTFARPFITGGAPGPGTVNWSGLEFVTVPAPAVNTLPEDRGSGGFAAIDADASLDLGTAGVSSLLWEEKGFVQSGFALVLGSPLAAARITLADHLSLSSGENTINYNAREIRVPDNVATAQDRAIITGIVSGTTHNDLLKTGTGTLELTAVNTFTGATIVQAGTLIISGSTASTIITDVMNGATLAGTGSTGAVLLESGGILSPGDNSIATLTASSLVWRAGGIARFTLGDRVALGGGNFEKGSSSGVFAFDFGGTGAMNQTYTLATFGSTTFAPSDFTATNLAPNVAGQFVLTGTTLVFSTVPPSPIANWRTTYFGPGAGNSGNSADNADPDKDGILNLAEYALGGNPTVPATGIAPGYTLPGGIGTFAFMRNLAATDIALRIEARDALTIGVWQTIATRAVGASAWSTQPGISVTDLGGGSVTVTDTAGPGSQSQRFLRLAIDHP